MKSNLIYCFIGVVLFTLGCSCKKDPIIAQNLIKNPSFEKNGQPTAENWFFWDYIYFEGDTGTTLSQGAPPQGGNWSLPLYPGWAPQPGYSKTYVTGVVGTNIYNLSVWMKSNNGWPGSISIGVLSQNQLTMVESVEDTLTNWNEYILKVTLTTTINDTIVVRLSAGSSNLSLETDKVFFDLVELVKL